MTLENQVCSLEIAKKLKELGVKQESAFYWSEYDGSFELVRVVNKDFGEWYSAFTVAELGEMLPQGWDFVFYHTVRGPYRIDYMEFNHVKSWEEANTEANARAKMLIYLIETGVLK